MKNLIIAFFMLFFTMNIIASENPRKIWLGIDDEYVTADYRYTYHFPLTEFVEQTPGSNNFYSEKLGRSLIDIEKASQRNIDRYKKNKPSRVLGRLTLATLSTVGSMSAFFFFGNTDIVANRVVGTLFAATAAYFYYDASWLGGENPETSTRIVRLPREGEELVNWVTVREFEDLTGYKFNR